MKQYNLDLRDLPGEIWKDIEGLEGKYMVSNKGRVKSLDRWFTKSNGAKVFYYGQILKMDFSGGRRGYLQNCTISFSLGRKGEGKNGKTATKRCVINRLVAKAFIPNPNNLEVVLHKDGDITNNCVENLQWASIEEHRDHERFTLGKKLGAAKKKVLCVETGMIYESLQKAAEAMGLKKVTSNHVGLTKALQKLTISGGKYKPNPEQMWRGYHWKEITE